MKSRYISSVVIAIIGASISTTLPYFFADSVNADHLVSGAILEGSIGLYFGISAGRPTSGRQPEIG
mgnify:CR=1 FL=1